MAYVMCHIDLEDKRMPTEWTRPPCQREYVDVIHLRPRPTTPQLLEKLHEKNGLVQLPGLEMIYAVDQTVHYLRHWTEMGFCFRSYFRSLARSFYKNILVDW